MIQRLGPFSTASMQISDKHKGDPVFANLYVENGEIYMKPKLYEDDKFYLGKYDISDYMKRSEPLTGDIKKQVVNALEKAGINLQDLNDKKGPYYVQSK